MHILFSDQPTPGQLACGKQLQFHHSINLLSNYILLYMSTVYNRYQDDESYGNMQMLIQVLKENDCWTIYLYIYIRIVALFLGICTTPAKQCMVGRAAWVSRVSNNLTFYINHLNACLWVQAEVNTKLLRIVHRALFTKQLPIHTHTRHADVYLVFTPEKKQMRVVLLTLLSAKKIHEACQLTYRLIHQSFQHYLLGGLIYNKECFVFYAFNL